MTNIDDGLKALVNIITLYITLLDIIHSITITSLMI